MRAVMQRTNPCLAITIHPMAHTSSMTTAVLIGICSANHILVQHEFSIDQDSPDSSSDYISPQEQDNALLDPNCPDAVQKTKLAKLYKTVIESTGLVASKKRRTVMVLESNPPNNQLKDPPSN
jgi:hypothetical protein